MLKINFRVIFIITCVFLLASSCKSKKALAWQTYSTGKHKIIYTKNVDLATVKKLGKDISSLPFPLDLSVDKSKDGSYFLVSPTIKTSLVKTLKDKTATGDDEMVVKFLIHLKNLRSAVFDGTPVYIALRDEQGNRVSDAYSTLSLYPIGKYKLYVSDAIDKGVIAKLKHFFEKEGVADYDIPFIIRKWNATYLARLIIPKDAKLTTNDKTVNRQVAAKTMIKKLSDDVFHAPIVGFISENSNLNTDFRTQYAGEKYRIKKSDIYYTVPIQEKEIRDIANKLVETGFIDDTIELIMNVNKHHNVYQFRMVWENPETPTPKQKGMFKQLGELLTESILKGSKVEFHLCDPYFRTKKILAL